MIQKKPSTKFITGIVTLLNSRIWEPHLFDSYDTPLYTATLLIPKDQAKTNEGMKIALETAVINGQALHRGGFRKKAMANTTIHDGDATGMNEIFRGCWVLNAATPTTPAIWDNTLYPITERNLVQSGCKIRVSLIMFSYVGDQTHPTGVGCLLCNIQKAFTRNEYEVLPDVDFDKFTENFTRVFLM